MPGGSSERSGAITTDAANSRGFGNSYHWKGNMSVALIVLGALILLVGFFILDRCNKILSNLQWLKDRFISKSPFTETGWRLDLAHEFISLKEDLAPLFFMPLSHIANDLKIMNERGDEEFDKKLKRWEDLELKEMEAFSKTKPTDDTAFIPSDSLKKALREWSEQRDETNIVENWNNLFREVYLELLSGKIKIPEAEEKLKPINSFSLGRGARSEEVEGIYNDWASKWGAGEWKSRLDYLLKKEEFDNDFKNEMRKMDISNNKEQT